MISDQYKLLKHQYFQIFLPNKILIKVTYNFKLGSKRGSKKVRPIYEDNSDCVLLYACGWQEYFCLPSNSHIKYNCNGGDAA